MTAKMLNLFKQILFKFSNVEPSKNRNNLAKGLNKLQIQNIQLMHYDVTIHTCTRGYHLLLLRTVVKIF